MNLKSKHGIGSLAAPSEDDRRKLDALPRDIRLTLINEEIGQGRADIDAGRFTELKTEDDIREFFEARRAAHEAPAL